MRMVQGTRSAASLTRVAEFAEGSAPEKRWWAQDSSSDSHSYSGTSVDSVRVWSGERKVSKFKV